MKLAPDGDITTPGTLTVVSGLVPTARGTYRSVYTANNASYPALPDACLTAYLATKSDGSRRLFAATSSRVYEANQAVSYSWTDRSSGTYSGIDAFGPMFTQFGDYTIKVNKGFATEASTSGAFANTGFTTAPKARIAVVQSNALWLFNVNDGTDKPDYVFVSDQGLPGSFTVSASSEAFQGAIQDTPGPLTAAITWQTGVIAFKKQGMYYLEYVGGTEKVVVRLISAEHGCVGPKALCSAEGVIYFYSDRGIYRYDGSFPQLLSQEISSLAFGGGGFGPSLLSTAVATHDEANNVVRFWKDFDSGFYSTELTFNYKSNQWGYGPVGIYQTMFQMSPTEAYEFPGIGTSGAGPAAPAAGTNFTTVMAFTTSNVLANLNNTTLPSAGVSWTGWYQGSQQGMTSVSRIFLGFYDPPVSTAVSGQVRSYAYPNGPTVITQVLFQNMDANDSVSVNISGRWLLPTIQISSAGGGFEISNMYYDPPPAGRPGGRS